MQKRKRIEILGVLIDRFNNNQAYQKAISFFKNPGKFFIATPNPEMIVLAQKDGEFKRILNSADLAIADGIGVVLASRILNYNSKLNTPRPRQAKRGGQNLKLTQRVTGIDLAEKLIAYCADNAFTVGFLGAKGDVAQKAADCQLTKNKKLKIAFTLNSDPKRAFDDINYAIRPQTSATGKQAVDLLLVAYGAPRQEYWVVDNLDKLPVKIAMVVGGAFDIWAGKLRRAPKIFIFLKLEWLFRLMVEPSRIKRQIALFKFGILVIKEKLKKINFIF